MQAKKQCDDLGHTSELHFYPHTQFIFFNFLFIYIFFLSGWNKKANCPGWGSIPLLRMLLSSNFFLTSRYVELLFQQWRQLEGIQWASGGCLGRTHKFGFGAGTKVGATSGGCQTSLVATEVRPFWFMSTTFYLPSHWTGHGLGCSAAPEQIYPLPSHSSCISLHQPAGTSSL